MKAGISHVWRHMLPGSSQCMCFDDSLHQCGRETWMSAGLTDRKMVECRRGWMDGNEKDEY